MELKTLRTFEDDVLANVALELLIQNGIDAVLADEFTMSLAPGFNEMLKGIKLQVPEDVYDEAEALLHGYESQAGAPDVDSDEGIQQVLQDSGSLLEGHFLLTSGRHSDKYIEKIRIIHDPEKVEAVGAALAARLEEYDPDVVIGPAMGGIVLAYETARRLGKKFAFTQREEGRMVIRPGFRLEPGTRAIVIEDIVTTGGSVFEVLEVLKSIGVETLAVGVIVDRSGGKVDFGVPMLPLLSVDIETWTPEECPLCKLGIDLTKPGSSGKA
jgi:orotate phosphoribosyltransferase